MVAPVVIGGVVAAGRIAAAVYQFAAPLVVRGVTAMAPAARSAAQSVATAAPGAAMSTVKAVGGAAKSLGSTVAGAGVATAAAAPGFMLDVAKSAVGFGGGAAASTSFGGRLGDVAKAGLGSLLKTGAVITALYYAAQYLRGQISERFFGAENLKTGAQKPLTAGEQAAADARGAQRDGSVKMTVMKDGVPRTVSMPSLPGESDEAALARGKGWWDKQAAEGKLPVAGEGMSVQVGGPSGSAFRLGADGKFAKADAVGMTGLAPFGGIGERGALLDGAMKGGVVGRSSEVISDPVRLGAVSGLAGVADGRVAGGTLPVQLRDVRGDGFSAVSVVPEGGSLADRRAQGVTSLIASDSHGGSAVAHSRELTVGNANVNRTVLGSAGDAIGTDARGRLEFKQDGVAARNLTDTAQRVGRVGSGRDSMTDALTASGRPMQADVMISTGSNKFAAAKFETVGSDGVTARGSVVVQEGQAKMSLLGADGKTPVATHSVKDAGFSFDKDGKPAFSGKAQESLKAFANDPRGQMRESVGMSREDGVFKSLTTPAASENGLAGVLQSKGKASMEM